MAPSCTAWFMVVAMASGAAALNGGHPPKGTGYWRWPYGISPFVIEKNHRDGLPDFSYFDKSNASLTAATIDCPVELTRPCSTTKKKSDEKCGADKQKDCYGGIFCEVSHKIIKSKNLSDVYFPNYIGAHALATPVNRTRRNILERAVGWLAVHAPYIGCTAPKIKNDGLEMCASDDDAACPQYTYTMTCEGLIAMAWGSPGYGGNKPAQQHVPIPDLKPGDAIAIHKLNGTKDLGISHFLLFREWVAEAGGAARVYQTGGEHGTTNMVSGTTGTPCKSTTAVEDLGYFNSETLENLSIEKFEGKQQYCWAGLRYGALVEEK